MDLPMKPMRHGQVSTGLLAQLERLATLRADNLLSANEFTLAKQRMLGEATVDGNVATATRPGVICKGDVKMCARMAAACVVYSLCGLVGILLIQWYYGRGHEVQQGPFASGPMGPDPQAENIHVSSDGSTVLLEASVDGVEEPRPARTEALVAAPPAAPALTVTPGPPSAPAADWERYATAARGRCLRLGALTEEDASAFTLRPRGKSQTLVLPLSWVNDPWTPQTRERDILLDEVQRHRLRLTSCRWTDAAGGAQWRVQRLGPFSRRGGQTTAVDLQPIGGPSKPYQEVALEDTTLGKRLFGKHGGRKKGGPSFCF